MALSDVIQKQKPAPPIITLVGTPGVGKTTLGALFPKAVFICSEDGKAVFDSWDDDVKPDLFTELPRAKYRDANGNMLAPNRVVSTKEVILEQMRMLLNEEHDYKTLVVDSVTSLDRMFNHELCERDGVDNVAEASGGFHKGYDTIAEWHGDVKNACEVLRKRKGMTVIFLAHAGIKKMKNRPDADEYTVYSLDMHEKSVPVYTNLVDAVIYIKNKEYVMGTQKDKKGNVTKFGRLTQTGDRVLITSGDGTVGYINAKNRYKLDQEIELPEGENPLLSMIPYFYKKEKEIISESIEQKTAEEPAQTLIEEGK